MDFDFLKPVLDPLISSPWKVAGATVAAFALVELAKVFKTLFINPQYSPLRNLPGPTGDDSFIFGHMLFLMAEPEPTMDKWFDTYGPAIQFRTLMRARNLLVKDPKAMSYIINHADDFPKLKDGPAGLDYFRELLGDGLLAVEGEDHRRQRKIMNPCFAPPALRDLLPVFYEKAAELREIWLTQLGDSKRGATIDVFPWLTKVTLDVIGITGFNYQFNSLVSDEKNELIKAFDDSFRPNGRPVLTFLQRRFPPFRIIPNEEVQIAAHAKQVLRRIATELAEEAKEAIRASESDEGLGRDDMLSLIVKANMSAGAKDSNRMSDEEVIGQIGTLLFGGHETTSLSVNFALWELAKPENAKVVKKLRAEVSAVASDQPSMNELDGLPYLDVVVKETLRVNGPVDFVFRKSARDQAIPISESYVDREGVRRNEIRIGKDEAILIPIIPMNHDKNVWGPDAKEFKPERWLKPGGNPRAAEVPGAWGNQMTFTGGVRGCIGYRFSVLEIKVLLFDIVRHFDFALPSPTPQIVRKYNLVTRPAVQQPDGSFKNTMPLVLKPISI